MRQHRPITDVADRKDMCDGCSPVVIRNDLPFGPQFNTAPLKAKATRIRPTADRQQNTIKSFDNTFTIVANQHHADSLGAGFQRFNTCLRPD